LAGEPLIILRYASALEARRDRLPDVPRGVIARTRVAVRDGDVLPARIEVAREKVTLDVRARIRWATPLASSTLAGIELHGPSRREEVQLDLLLGNRSAAPAPEPGGASVTRLNLAVLPRLSVVMLQPSRVLREVLGSALARFAREGSGWDLHLDAVATTDAFVEALARRRRDLAVVDCDAIGAVADSLLAGIRAHDEWARLPVVLLARSGAGRADDGCTVTMQKPVSMKALLRTTGLLLRRGG
jgi:hypothetical protein